MIRTTAALLLIAALGLGGVAVAQPAPAPPDDDARAEALFAQGKREYDLGHFDLAAAAFEEAYRLSDEPLLLFNLAQAQRKQEHCAEALAAYQAYLRYLPQAPNRAKVEGFIVEAEACVARRPPRPVEPPPPTPPPTGPAPLPPAPSPPTVAPAPEPPAATPPAAGSTIGATPRAAGRGLRLAGLGSAGVGLVALGAGLYFNHVAGARADDIEACPEPCAPATWQPLDADGRAARRDARIAFAVGGVGVIAGAAFYLLGARSRPDEQPITVTTTATGATLHAHLRF